MLGRDGLHQRPGELENGHPAAGTDVYHSYDDNVGGDEPSCPDAHAGYGLLRGRLGLLQHIAISKRIYRT